MIVPHIGVRLSWYRHAKSDTHGRLAHHAPGPSRLSLHLPRDVAQDSGSASDASRVGEIHGLADVPFGAAAVGDADGV